jgi:hypothetical protein
LENLAKYINQKYQITNILPSLPYPKEWAASKLIEGDFKVIGAVKGALKDEKFEVVQAFLSRHKEAANEIIRMRQQWIDAA